MFSFSVPLDPVQIEALKEKEKEEREKWSFWPKQPFVSQLFRNAKMKKIENLIAVNNKHVWTNWNRSWNIATIGKLGLAFMQWMQLFCRFSENIALLFPLIPFANICGIQFKWFVYKLKHWFWNLFEQLKL